ncbi:hypothetical protein LEMLEM_LOCUS1154 [Lemmus lemmus]
MMGQELCFKRRKSSVNYRSSKVKETNVGKVWTVCFSTVTRANHTVHVAPCGGSMLEVSRSPAQKGQHGCPAPKAVSPVLCEASELVPVWQTEDKLQMMTWKLSSLPAHLPLDCSPH